MCGEADEHCPGSGVLRVVRRGGGDEAFSASSPDGGAGPPAVGTSIERAPRSSGCARDLAPAKAAAVQRAIADVRRRMRAGAGERGEALVLRLPVGEWGPAEVTGFRRRRVRRFEEAPPASWLEDISRRLS